MMKRILDSVHGYIQIDDDYCKNIIDTEYFQRLRRIEQTSTRSIFPSARHDRFIHSLGVFHLGCMFVDRIEEQIAAIPEAQQPQNRACIYESYRLACLLHDVAHSPFSHTFEEYFENQWSDLKGTLCRVVNVQSFREEWEAILDPSAPHERMSAIVAVGVFGQFIEDREADKEMVARMIIGLKYQDNIHRSFENAMIDLIHGDVIDADGLDYVCRDSWASGYSTTKVDVDRLIDSVRIIPDGHGIFKLCYTDKSLNEIEAVLKVKTFQQSFVINHHTVMYEQKLLVKAMESAALYHFEGVRNDEDEAHRQQALQKLCSIDCFYKTIGDPGKVTEHTHIKVALPMDDDFIALMKPVSDDKYVSQWLSRKYNLAPLWKSKADFYQCFKHLRGCKLTESSWVFHNDCKKFISDRFCIALEDIIIKKATPKYKENFAMKVDLVVNGEVITYKDLLPEDVHSYDPPKSEFFYIYVPKDSNKQAILDAIVEESAKYFINR